MYQTQYSGGGGGAAGGAVLAIEQTTDIQTIDSANFNQMGELSGDITISEGSRLDIDFNATTFENNFFIIAYFDVLVNGVEVLARGVEQYGAASPALVLLRKIYPKTSLAALGAGTYTVTVRWKATAGHTLTCTPIAAAGVTNAYLNVTELLAP